MAVRDWHNPRVSRTSTFISSVRRDIARRYGATRWQIYDWMRRFWSGCLPAREEIGASPAFVRLDHVAVADRHPVEARHAALIRGTWEVDMIGFHRKQNLARAAEFMEADEDEANDLLET